jgi:hypothetical protein
MDNLKPLIFRIKDDEKYPESKKVKVFLKE